jgi:hypothetical protein
MCCHLDFFDQKPATFRALATADGEPITVGPVTIWVRFPSETEMMADPVIQAHATNLWTQTLALCTPTNRHEVGCWILLNTATDTYSFSATTNGPATQNNQDSNINLLPLPFDSPLFPHLADVAAIYAVASLHTHTPSTYVSGLPRIAGPSPNDASASASLSMPGLVFDYIEKAETPGEIPIGHPINAPARLYPTVVCPRRTR